MRVKITTGCLILMTICLLLTIETTQGQNTVLKHVTIVRRIQQSHLTHSISKLYIYTIM